MLGLGTPLNDKLLPSAVRSLDGTRLIELSCGDMHMAVLTGSYCVPVPAAAKWGGGGGGGGWGVGPEALATEGADALIFSFLLLFWLLLRHPRSSEAHEAFSWGWNGCGQLGHGDFTDRSEPTRVEALGSRVSSIACGAAHTAATICACDVGICAVVVGVCLCACVCPSRCVGGTSGEDAVGSARSRFP